MEPEVHTEASAIEALKGILPEDSYNVGQAEETEAKPEVAAEPKEVKEETKEIPQEVSEDEEIEIKGEKYKVPKAIKESIMLQADYTRKTMELAEQRKALEAEKGKIPADVTQKLSHYEKLLGDAVLMDQQTDWAQMLREDPIGALEKKFLAEQRAAEWQQVQAKNQKEFADKQSQAAKKEWEQLIAKQPDFKDAAKFKEHDEKAKALLIEQGYDPNEVGSALFDHRVRLMLDKVIKYDELQKAKTETAKKIEKLPPKVERPGVPSGSDGQASKAAMQKLRQSGKVDDAAEALRALLG